MDDEPPAQQLLLEETQVFFLAHPQKAGLRSRRDRRNAVFHIRHLVAHGVDRRSSFHVERLVKYNRVPFLVGVPGGSSDPPVGDSASSFVWDSRRPPERVSSE